MDLFLIELQNMLGQTILLHRSFFQQVDSFWWKSIVLQSQIAVKLLSETDKLKDREFFSALDCLLLLDSAKADGFVVD